MNTTQSLQKKNQQKLNLKILINENKKLKLDVEDERARYEINVKMLYKKVSKLDYL